MLYSVYLFVILIAFSHNRHDISGGSLGQRVFYGFAPVLYLDIVDMVLVMTVEPGFGGQSLIRSALEKATLIKKIIKSGCRSDILIEADGGIKASNAADVAACGVDILVAGSAVFGADDYKTAIDEIRRNAVSALK